MEQLDACPKCGNSHFDSFLLCKDYSVSKEDFRIVSCSRCSFKFTNPRPGKIEIGKYYESEDYISHSDTTKGFINKLYHLIKGISIRNKFRIIENLQTSEKNLLDIGCGTGSFINGARQYKYQAIGIEPNEKARNHAVTHYGLEVYDENKLSEFTQGKFSVITMWHVLEHVHDIKSRLKEIFKLLSQDGFVLIAVPNYTSWDATYYRNGWAAYDLPRHLYHFSPQVIKEFMIEAGFKHYKSLPMKFDSFYVSMLSEKYRKSFLGIIKAAFIGLYSNFKAFGNAEKYSSVIYIFRK